MIGYTTIEQSKKLLSIGLNPETADMCYVIDYAESNIYGRDQYHIQIDLYGLLVGKKDNIPCWSLSALLELMPDIIEEDTVVFGLNIKKNFIEYYNSSMGVLYATYHSVNAETTTDAAFEMVCWLLENKFIKTE